MLLNKKILILGGTGSLGNALVTRYIKDNTICIVSRSENTQWVMKKKFESEMKLSFEIGDIRDEERMRILILRFQPEIIIIAAALKHIDICETNIEECIKTNIQGVKNILNLIQDTFTFLKTVVFISTDKACAPVNSYGMCKSISERLVVEKAKNCPQIKFINVRYGNVINSRGSILPFYKEIGKSQNNHIFPVTDPRMTRYFMSLDQSVNLIEYAIEKGTTGDTVIPKNIISHKILDVAKYFIEKYGGMLKHVGIRAGEKLHETLISFTESLRTIEVEDYYIIKPSYTRVENCVVFENEEFNSKCVLKEIDKDTFEG